MTPPASADPLGVFRAEAIYLLEEGMNALGLGDYASEVPSRLAVPPPEKGEFAFPCFPYAKVARKSPQDLAKELVAALPGTRKLEVLVEGPYVNFRIPPAEIVPLALASIRETGVAFGTHPPSGRSVIVEHTSANPNGPFHVGRARNPITGDALARILRRAGHSVVAEYYVNDMGKQVAILAWGLANLRAEDLPPAEREKIDHDKVRYYQRANELVEKDPRVAGEVNALLRRFEERDPDVAHAFREAAGLVLAGMRESLSRLNVAMDRYSWESEYVLTGRVEPVVEKLKKSEHAREDETGAWYLDLTAFGIPGKNPRWVFLRRDGTSLYTTRDLAYHEDKLARADRLVNVLGEDHKLTMRQLGIALEVLGETRKPEVVWISFVSLPEGKMSTRRNRVVFVDDLMDEAAERAYEEVRLRRSEELSEDEMRAIAGTVGIGAVRFNISSVQSEKSIVFRWEDALNFDGDSAPFCQYAHARASSILRKAAAEGHGPAPNPALLTHPSEIALVKTLSRLPTVIADCAAALKVHPVTAYAVEVANAFNQFYRDCPVLLADGELRGARLDVVAATRTVLANTLDLVGVTAPETM